jgi:hypothetical protein
VGRDRHASHRSLLGQRPPGGKPWASKSIVLYTDFLNKKEALWRIYIAAVTRRWGPVGAGCVLMPAALVHLDAMTSHTTPTSFFFFEGI